MSTISTPVAASEAPTGATPNASETSAEQAKPLTETREQIKNLLATEEAPLHASTRVIKVNGSEWITTTDAARELGISRNKLLDLRNAGYIDRLTHREQQFVSAQAVKRWKSDTHSLSWALAEVDESSRINWEEESPLVSRQVEETPANNKAAAESQETPGRWQRLKTWRAERAKQKLPPTPSAADEPGEIEEAPAIIVGEIAADFLSYHDILTSVDDDNIKAEINKKAARLRKGEFEGNEEKYAKALVELRKTYEKSEVRNSANEIHSNVIERLRKMLGSNYVDSGMDPFTHSKTWAYWDLAKQYYLNNHPGESGAGYHLGNPMENRSIRQQIEDRHVGWEIHAAYNVHNAERASIDRLINANPSSSASTEVRRLLNLPPDHMDNSTLSSLNLEELGLWLRLLFDEASLATPPPEPVAPEFALSSRRTTTRIEREKVVRPTEVVAVGDLHGNLPMLWINLKSHALVSETHEWTGGNKRVVILGDFLADRSADGEEILKSIYSLQEQARKAGGDIDVIAGNHDDWLLAFLSGQTVAGGGDPIRTSQIGAQGLGLMKFVNTYCNASDDGIAGFDYLDEKKITGKTVLEAMQKSEEGRKRLEEMCRFKLCEQIDDTLFLHTPLTKKIANYLVECMKTNDKSLGEAVDRINQVYQTSLRNMLLLNQSQEPQYRTLVDLFLRTNNRCELGEYDSGDPSPTAQDSKEDQEIAKLLLQGGVNTVIHGHEQMLSSYSLDTPEGTLIVHSADTGAGQNVDFSADKIQQNSIWLRPAVRVVKQDSTVEAKPLGDFTQV